MHSRENMNLSERGDMYPREDRDVYKIDKNVFKRGYECTRKELLMCLTGYIYIYIYILFMWHHHKQGFP